MGSGRKLNWEDIIVDCQNEYNNMYTYDIDEQEEYINIHTTKIIGHCEKHGVFRLSVHSHRSKGIVCKGCGVENSALLRRLNWETVIEQCINKYDGKYWYDITEQQPYTNNKMMMVVHCEEHGAFPISVHSHKNKGRGCAKCGGSERLSWVTIIPDCITKYDNKYTYNIDEQPPYENINTKMTIHCLKHGVFHTTVGSHKNNGSGCPNCDVSNGEITISTYLSNNDIISELHYRFDDCRGDSLPLIFDFYLPEYNILIEYDGIQHFQYMPKFFHKKGYWQFEKQQRYDEIKNQYCKEKGIHLLRIPYFEDTIEMLDNYLGKFL